MEMPRLSRPLSGRYRDRTDSSLARYQAPPLVTKAPPLVTKAPRLVTRLARSLPDAPYPAAHRSPATADASAPIAVMRPASGP
jgi:hypothetical protein